MKDDIDTNTRIREEIEKGKERIMSSYIKGEITEKEYKKFMVMSGNYVISGTG